MPDRSNHSNEPSNALLEFANRIRDLPDKSEDWRQASFLIEYDKSWCEWTKVIGLDLMLGPLLEEAQAAGAFDGPRLASLRIPPPRGACNNPIICLLLELERMSGIPLQGRHEPGTIAGKIADALEKVARAKSAARPLRTSDVKANKILKFLRKSKAAQTITAMHGADCGDRKTIKIRLENLIDSGEVVKLDNGRFTATKP